MRMLPEPQAEVVRLMRQGWILRQQYRTAEPSAAVLGEGQIKPVRMTTLHALLLHGVIIRNTDDGASVYYRLTDRS